MAQTVFCQIANQTIDPPICLEIQEVHEPRECFGCGAHCRLCAHCREDPPAYPELGLCPACLILALSNEPLAAPQQQARCISCGDRGVYYDEYELCLHCATREYCKDVRPSSTPSTTVPTSEFRPTEAVESKTRYRKARLYSPASRGTIIQLTDRDLALLEGLHVHGFLATSQINRLFFDCGASMLRRRLRMLFDQRLVGRMPVVSTAASTAGRKGLPPFVYTLGSEGRVLLAQRLSQRIERKAPKHPRSLEHVFHRYWVNEAFVALSLSVRAHEYHLKRWLQGKQLKVEEDGMMQWEQFSHQLLQEAAECSVTDFRPHAYAEVETRPGTTHSFFLEVDLATLSQSRIRQRALMYAAYADRKAGYFQRRFGHDGYRVLIITTPDYRGRSRRRNILNTLQAYVGTANLSLFWATTIADLGEKDFFSPIWFPATDPEHEHALPL